VFRLASTNILTKNTLRERDCILGISALGHETDMAQRRTYIEMARTEASQLVLTALLRVV
jgi:hypothetical protein